MKYQLKVTAAVMIIRPSSAMRVRAVTGTGRAGSSRMPSSKKGYTLRYPRSAMEGRGGGWSSTHS